MHMRTNVDRWPHRLRAYLNVSKNSPKPFRLENLIIFSPKRLQSHPETYLNVSKTGAYLKAYLKKAKRI